MILGVDEVGRGAWAGPLVVGAVCLNGAVIPGLTDSKILTKKRREALYDAIMESSASAGLGWVHAEEVDSMGLGEALRLATRRAVEQIKTPYHEIIIDGTVNFLADTRKGDYVTTLKKADLLIPSVSAASIVAKVARDRWMTEQEKLFHGYGFSAHVGYGTAKHLVALQKFGACDLHRRSFAPVQKITGEVISKPLKKLTRAETTKQIGDSAEDVAANELKSRGHVILERNWKTKFCEIDIVSHCNDTIYFTEVKYRKSSQYGDGLAAITLKKQRQMKFAATLYATNSKDMGMRLAVISMSGTPPQVEHYLELG